ncbi:MAG: succinate dehydrogenase/fumarate reductase iron-sulfur subunit [Gemmatimonadaceae bacterium]|nr:succinate dehydrogenase/fumarate reductase iron-sulfur subunit [Gemmatimonadaceae bacterium]
MKFTLKVWRQASPTSAGRLETYQATDIPSDASFLEMIDIVNDHLEESGKEPIAFAHDCREGICGSCSMMIDGVAHGPVKGAATCQVHMRTFTDGQEITIEPWRSAAFPVLKDLITDRAAFDRIIQAGGYISAPTGGARDANEILVAKTDSDAAMDAAACIGCGACVAACPNGSASLFTAAKVAHLGRLPQGQPERYKRVEAMVAQMDSEHFGHCTLYGECQEACPKQISIDVIAQMNRDYIVAMATRKPEMSGSSGNG